MLRKVEIIVEVKDVRVFGFQFLEEFCDQPSPFLIFHLEIWIKVIVGLGNPRHNFLFSPDVVDYFVGRNRIDKCPQRAFSPERFLSKRLNDADKYFTGDVFPVWRGAADRIFHPEADLGPVLEHNFCWVSPFYSGEAGDLFSSLQVNFSSIAPRDYLIEDFGGWYRLLEGYAG